MSLIRSFDHVGITVRDLDAVTDSFVGLGFRTEGRTVLEGEFVDTVIGIPHCRAEVVVLRPPGGGTGLELSRFLHPEPGRPPPGRRCRSVRGQLAHGVGARTRGVHREPGPADRLIGGQPASCSTGRWTSSWVDPSSVRLSISSRSTSPAPRTRTFRWSQRLP
jgi:catechol 2,3-dioxygenase-like lactoylglutathione lyase family enzyme